MNSHELAKPELIDPQVKVDSDVNKVAGFKSMNLSNKPLIFPSFYVRYLLKFATHHQNDVPSA